jgi:hypothetical protein
MTLSRILFRLWVILAGLWLAYIVWRALFVIWLSEGEVITTIQWAMHWALIPPAGLLLGVWLISWIGRRFKSL